MGLGALQPGHLLVILAIVLVIFGPGKLGDIGKALGNGVRELKKGADLGGDGSASHGTAATISPSVTSAAPSAPTANGVRRPCPKCRAAVPASDRFCGECGSAIAAI
jgi:sec-independent protein translocase protein TatA